MSKYYTVSGIKFSDAKSGLQKCIRRGLLTEALAYVIDMDKYPSGTQKGNRTNMINRLKIIAVEDVFYPEIMKGLCDWFLAWERTRETLESRKYLISIVRALCLAPKLRLLSDLKIFVDPEEYRKHLGDKYDNLFAVHGVFSDCLTIRGLDKKDFVKYGSEYDEWLEKIYKTFPKTNKEKWLYSLASFAYARCELKGTVRPELLADSVADCMYNAEIRPIYACGWLEPSIVCDIHTGKKKDAKSLYKFAVEGAKVENERTEYYIEILREAYVENKLKSDQNLTVKPLKAMPEFLQHQIYAQKVTSSYKPFTFVTREKIYKGPFEKKKAQEIIDIAMRFREEFDDKSVLIPEKYIWNENVYLAYKNIGDAWNPKTIYTVVKKTTKGNILGRIVDRKSMGIYQGNELIETGKMNYERMIWHFMARFILGRGDSGMWNYINNHGIDFDDARGNIDSAAGLDKLLFAKNQRYGNEIMKEVYKRGFRFLSKLEKLALKGEEKIRADLIYQKLAEQQKMKRVELL